MNFKEFLEYLRTKKISILVGAVIMFYIYYKENALFGFIFFALGLVQNGFQYNARIKFLQKQGLTEKEYSDQQFQISWTETRQAGVVKYCLFNGGLITGSILSIFIGMFLMMTKTLGDPVSDIGIMMSIIWKSFVLGFIVASAIYRIFWILNEKRFSKLINKLPLQNFSTPIPSQKPFR